MTELSIDINTVKGFLDPEEGDALYKYAKKYSVKGDCLEIGSYCGKSSVYLGMAVKENGKKHARSTLHLDMHTVPFLAPPLQRRTR